MPYRGSNYSFVVDSSFRPFSFQEMVVPLSMYKDAYDKIADEYDKLSSQADVLEAMGANDRDRQSGVYDRYKTYSDDLRKEADNLMTHGLNIESRRRLSDLRRRYNTDIVPIQNAWNKREEESRMQLDALSKNPNLMVTRDAASTSLDYYINNPTGGYGVINGANITAQMADMAGRLAKQIREGSARKEDIDPYTYNYIQRYGLDENIIRDWRNSPTLSAMFRQVMEANNVTPEALEGSANAQSIMDRSTRYAEEGMWHALGEDRSQLNENYITRLNAQAAKELAVARQKAKIAASGKGGNDGNNNYFNLEATNIGIDTVDGYSAKGLTELANLANNDGSLKSDYFGKAGSNVNPIAIYDEYQKELDKRYKTVIAANASPGAMASEATRRERAMEGARKAVLNKYSKYGVTDILNETQYNALKGMGYDETDNNPGKAGITFDDFYNGFNDLVVQKTAYDIPMAKGAYDEMDAKLVASLIRNQKSLGARVFKYDGYKKGNGVTKLSDLGVNTKKPDESTKILTIGYDPNYPGLIRVSYVNGNVFLMDPGLIGGSGMTNQLRRLENEVYTDRTTGVSRRANPYEITSGIARNINRYNPGASSTSSSAY